MLLLSRKPQETIVFPNLGITIEVARIQGGKVRVGIDAPPEIAVLRGELVGTDRKTSDPPTTAEKQPKPLDHRLRNRMHTIGLGLTLLQRQLEAERYEESEDTLLKLLAIFRQLDAELGQAETLRAVTPTRRALVVDDDSNESELLAGILRMNGYEVESAADGYEAIAALRRNRPDFVLLDMNMPRCDGAAALNAIRRNPEWRDLRVFAVTGNSQREMGISTGAAGVDRWFQKPLDPEVLLRAMSAEPVPANQAL